MNIGKRIKDLFTGMWEDTKAVSPIVATLVLVVVAITGAAGVGTIMGTFSSDVSDQSSSAGAADAASTELLITGSTTVQPVSELLATAYMNTHQGIRVTVQGGGSGMGVTAVGMDVADIGAASRPVKDTELAKYPYIQTHKIGGSAVVVIADPAGIYAGKNVTPADLKLLYDDDPATGANLGGVSVANTTVVQRAESSGTEDTFADYIGLKGKLDDAVAGTAVVTVLAHETGNAGVLARVKSTTNSIGFVDFGFAVESDLANVEILGVVDGGLTTTFVNVGNSTTTLKGEIEDELTNEEGTSYAKGLTRPLNYITKGAPSAVEQDFIAFAKNLDQQTYFEQCGYFPILDIA